MSRYGKRTVFPLERIAHALRAVKGRADIGPHRDRAPVEKSEVWDAKRSLVVLGYLILVLVAALVVSAVGIALVHYVATRGVDL